MEEDIVNYGTEVIVSLRFALAYRMMGGGDAFVSDERASNNKNAKPHTHTHTHTERGDARAQKKSSTAARKEF